MVFPEGKTLETFTIEKIIFLSSLILFYYLKSVSIFYANLTKIRAQANIDSELIPKMAKKEKVLIGRVENLDFPSLNLNRIEAKIDTGAYSTALHCHKMWVSEIDGKEVLHFDILDPKHPEYQEQIFTSSNFTKKKVRSSNGRKENRYVIKTKITLAGKTYLTDVSLTDRQKMKYPVLVGRKLLQNGYIIDVSKLKIT